MTLAAVGLASHIGYAIKDCPLIDLAVAELHCCLCILIALYCTSHANVIRLNNIHEFTLI